jgi:hypothetical protein
MALTAMLKNKRTSVGYGLPHQRNRKRKWMWPSVLNFNTKINTAWCSKWYFTLIILATQKRQVFWQVNHHSPGLFWWQIDDNALFLYHNGTSFATTAYLEWGTCTDKTCITKNRYVSSAQCYKNPTDRNLKFSSTLSHVLLLSLM